MTTQNRPKRVQEMYRAFAAGDRALVEALLSQDFSFSSPVDVGLDRAGYFERCWPGAGRGQSFDFVRVVEAEEEVIVTYEMTHPDGRRGRNTEVLWFNEHDQIARAEVYFGWNL